MTIQAIHHIQITIPAGQEEKARGFYCELLALPEIPKPQSLQNKGGFWLQLRSQEIHVGTEDGFDRNQTKAHIAYLVDDLLLWREKLIDAGFQIIDSIVIPNYSRFEFRDPFGNRIEFIQKII